MNLIGPISYNSLVLPMVGTRICAGFPSPADDFLDDEIDLARILMPNRVATFLWRVAGSSMIDAGIQDGSVVVVDRSAKPKHGDVVVASIDGMISLKLFQNDGKLSLAFANRTMPSFTVDETATTEIWGVVTWTLHQPSLKS